MANGKQNMKLRYEDFETYLPKIKFNELQLKFFKDTFNLLINNCDTSKVTCIPARCGIGKSTFIKAFMRYCIDNSHIGRHEPLGLIVITDSVKRLEELSNSGRKEGERKSNEWGEAIDEWGIENHYENFEKSVIVLKSDIPFMEQLIEQHYKPIVLLSTQRYFMLSDKIRKQLFSFQYKDNPLKRGIVIFDESPYFSETIKIDSDNLTRIESALYKGLSDEVKGKEFAIREFKIFKDRLLDQMRDKEKIREDSNVTIYWKDECYPTITPDDSRFFKIIMENIDSLTKQYNKIYKDLMNLKQFAEKGAIFNSVKKKYGNYEQSLTMVIDNRDYFYLGEDKKFFVLDATADVDPRYNLDYTDVIDCTEYNKALNMKITNVSIPTSKNILCNGGKKSYATTNAIINYLKNKTKSEVEKHKDLLIVVYSDLFRRFQKDFSSVGYFGNLKGFNDYKELYKMAHIGMNRYPFMAYFYIYCGCNMKVYEDLSDMTEAESLVFFESLSVNRNEIYQGIINNIMLNMMLADFEQNIFRLAIRDYKNVKDVHIWTFYNNENDLYNTLTTKIENRYKAYGVTFEYEDTPTEVKIEAIKNRKPPNGKRKTNAQKIIEWCDSQQKGKEFKLSELLTSINLSNSSFKDTKKSNGTIRNMFEKMSVCTKKRGYYKII